MRRVVFGTRKTLGTLAAFGTLLGGAPLGAQDTTFAARVTPTVTAEAGRPVTLTARLANRADRAVAVVARLGALPPRWRVLTGDSTLDIAPRAERAWVTSVAVPSGARAGRYVLPLTFDVGDARVADSVVVTVGEHAALTLLVVETLGPLVAGEQGRAVVRVHNRGNAPSDVRLAAAARALPPDAPAIALDATLDRAALHLDPGDAQLVTLGVAAPRDVRRVAPLVAELRVEGPSLSETLRTIVVPDGAVADDRFARIPARATIRASGPAARVELVGRGALGTADVELVARGALPLRPTDAPGRPDLLAAFGERREYRAAFRTTHTRLTLGDQVVALSPLTEPGRFAFGAAARREFSTLGAPGALTLDAIATRREVGAAVTTHLGPRFTLGATALRRTGSEAGHVASASVTARVDSTTQLAVETGLGRRASLPLGTPRALGGAARVELTTERRRVAATLRHVARGDAYPGELRGTREQLGAARVDLGGRWQLDGRVARSASEGAPVRVDPRVTFDPTAADTLGALGTLVVALPVERRTQVELGVAPSPSVRVSVASSARTGTSGTLAYDGVERLARAQASRRLGALHVAASAELGAVVDRRLGVTRAMRRVAATTHLPLGTRLWGSGFADVRRGPTLWSGPATTVSAGLSAHAALSAALTADVSAATSEHHALAGDLVPVASRARTAQLDARVEYLLPNRHALALRVREIAFGGSVGRSATRTVALEYGLPLRLPLWRAPRATHVASRLVDQASGRGVARALVQLDDDPTRVAMTDAEGRVRFRDASAGTHRLTLLDARATSGLVPATPAALTVAATRERTREHMREQVVALVPGGRVRGTICRPDDDALRLARLRHVGGAAAGADSVPNDCAVAVSDAVVELTGAADTVRVVSDARGAFDVVGVRPGAWRVRVASAPLPDGLSAPAVALVVDAGRATTVALRAAPAARTFRPLPVTSLRTTAP